MAGPEGVRDTLLTVMDVLGTCIRAHRFEDSDGATAGAASAGALTAASAEPVNTMHGVCEQRAMLT